MPDGRDSGSGEELEDIKEKICSILLAESGFAELVQNCRNEHPAQALFLAALSPVNHMESKNNLSNRWIDYTIYRDKTKSVKKEAAEPIFLCCLALGAVIIAGIGALFFQFAQQMRQNPVWTSRQAF
ncbi:hypothetical protein [Acetonema longum]|uniref:Uncharacterized protein n=1 Tax=Acetonema longum DSM 6540 TaxID=1009370 RepID=F7NME0_9FIRM|nr:hypothetical protein [Acetonema longum]EGO62785.1 hypothetical protein ALO_16227 [Acetonema longum DSM 6540]